MIISKTPFRISFFGGGTDYPDWINKEGHGSVISTSIDKYCYLMARFLPPFFENRHRIVWSKIELESDFDSITHPAIRECLKYLEFSEAKGIEIHHQGDLPARSGIGSSSSFAVGMIKSLYALKKMMISNCELAERAIYFEQEILKENVGYQDQVCAAYGGFNRIDFFPKGGFRVQPVTLDWLRVKELESNLMLFFTGKTRIASHIAKDIINNLESKRTQLLKLGKMVEEACNLIRNGNDLKEFGEMLHEGWMYKKELSTLVSNDFIDNIYKKAMQHGALGGKLLGAGISGFMLFYVPFDYRASVMKALKEFIHIPFAFDRDGSTIVSYTKDQIEPLLVAT